MDLFISKGANNRDWAMSYAGKEGIESSSTSLFPREQIIGTGLWLVQQKEGIESSSTSLFQREHMLGTGLWSTQL